MFRKMVKFLLAVPVAVLIVMVASTPAAAAEIRGYENIIIASGDVVNDDLYLAGDRVAIHGTVNGDVLAAGNTIIVDGTVSGDVIALGSTVSIEGDVTGSVRAAASTVTIGGTIGKDVVAAGSSITIQEASGIGRDLVFGASNIQVESVVTGNIQGIAEKVRIADIIGGNADIEVNELILTPTAKIQGNLIYVSDNEVTIQSGAVVGGEITRRFPVTSRWNRSWPVVFPVINLWFHVFSFLGMLLVGIVIILVAPRKSAETAMAIRRKPGPSLGWGALLFFVSPVAILISMLTIIGIPVGLLGILVYGLLLFVSQLVVGLFIGQWIFEKLNIQETTGSLVGALATGFLLLSAVRLIPVFGFIVWLITTLFGIGAIGVLVFRRRNKAVPVAIEVIEPPQA